VASSGPGLWSRHTVVVGPRFDSRQRIGLWQNFSVSSMSMATHGKLFVVSRTLFAMRNRVTAKRPNLVVIVTRRYLEVHVKLAGTFFLILFSKSNNSNRFTHN
jgi:hypothetical protein